MRDVVGIILKTAYLCMIILSVYISFILTKANSESNHFIAIQVNICLHKQRIQKAGGRQVKVVVINTLTQLPLNGDVGVFSGRYVERNGDRMDL